MSKELNDQPKNNEEIDLLILFNYIGDKINGFFNIFKRLFLFIFSTIIYASKALISNMKLIALVMVIAGVLGIFLEKTKQSTYESKMLVRTYFDAKYQLSTNIKYYNALLGDKDYKTLAHIFGIDKDSISQILAFEMSPGPETENDRIVEYDRFVKSIDSIRAQEISFSDFIENRDIYSGNLFEIRVESKKKDIFNSLETGINTSFNNQYSTKKMQKRDSMISIKRENILNSIEEIDSLKRVYIKVIENESKSTQANISLGEGFPLKQEKSQTKEYQLLDKEIQLRDQLSELEEQKVEENVFFDVISSFQSVGNEVSYIYEKYTIVLPILAFILLCLGFMIKRFLIYVNNYNG